MNSKSFRFGVSFLVLVSAWSGAALGQSINRVGGDAFVSTPSCTASPAAESSGTGLPLGCACSGSYSEGDRVTLTVDYPDYADGLLAGHQGTVVAGWSGPYLEILVEWDDWFSGHSGNCAYADCGTCVEGGSSRWWVDCGSITSACGDSNTACLDSDRFEVEVFWDTGVSSGQAEVVPGASDSSAIFSFFDPSNWEMLIKVLDGCAINDHFWIFYAATTNVEFSVRVTDTESGMQRTYFNPLGYAAEPVQDVQAFATCPQRHVSATVNYEAGSTGRDVRLYLRDPSGTVRKSERTGCDERGSQSLTLSESGPPGNWSYWIELESRCPGSATDGMRHDWEVSEASGGLICTSSPPLGVDFCDSYPCKFPTESCRID